jgi:hypothetical protein
MEAITLMFATETAIAFLGAGEMRSVLLKWAIAFLEAGEMRSLCGLSGGRSGLFC